MFGVHASRAAVSLEVVTVVHSDVFDALKPTRHKTQQLYEFSL